MNTLTSIERVASNKKRFAVYIILALITFGLYLYRYQPVMLHDDWQVMRMGLTTQYPWFSLSVQHDGRRPLMFFPFALVASIIGTDVNSFYFVGLILLLMSAIVIFELSRIFINNNDQYYISLLISCIYLVYPVLTRQWITIMGGRIDFPYLLNCLILYAYVKKRKPYLLIFVLLILTASLLHSEAGFGFILGWSALLFITDGHKDIKILYPYLLLPIYVIWSLSRSSDPYMSGMVQSSIFSMFFSTIKNTVISIYSSFNYWGYGLPLPQRPIIDGLPWYASNGLILGVVVIFFLFIGYGISKLFHTKNNLDDGNLQHLSKKLMLSGGVLYLFAFFPTNLAFGAGFTDPLGTRHFSFSAIGASILIVGFILFINTVLVKNQLRIKAGTISIIVLICFLGAAAHMQYRNDINDAWMRQKLAWSKLFDEVPNIKDDSCICFIVKRDENNRIPIIRLGEANDGLKLLYDNETLSGAVLDSNDLSRLTSSGLITSDNGYIPWDKLILIDFDESNNMLQVISHEDDFGILLPENYNPRSLILEHGNPTKYRYLVER